MAKARARSRHETAQKTRSEPQHIFPRSAVATLDRAAFAECDATFAVADVAPLVGMSPNFISRALGSRKRVIGAQDLLTLLDQDSFRETFVPRSKVLSYLLSRNEPPLRNLVVPDVSELHQGDVLDVIRRLPPDSIQCVVTSTPYWGMRVYKDAQTTLWADGVEEVYGHEQTPEAFVRHSVQILYELMPLLDETASVWWNLMDTYNTRTQIRGNAYEAVQAMGGKGRAWIENEVRRYSAGHAYLKDGEQCGIPAQIAERACRLGYFLRSTITWAKPFSVPEPQNSRVSRRLEYVLHLSKTRTPKFNKAAFRQLPATLGGRNPLLEPDKLTDVWHLQTSSGGNGHGAQFPLSLPGRCIGITTAPGDVVLDPFVGTGTSGAAARCLGRRFIGIDVSADYIGKATVAIEAAAEATRSTLADAALTVPPGQKYALDEATAVAEG